MNKSESKYFNTALRMDEALLALLEQKDLEYITVKELCRKAGVNRSTFYLHYTDIYDMMEKIENELTGDIEDLIHTHPVSPFNEDSFPFIEDIFSILAENRDICAALLGPNGDISFLHRIENILSEHSLNALKETFPEKMDDLTYYYAFCLSGCIGLVKAWLSDGSSVSPQHMAELTFKLIMNALRGFYPDFSVRHS